MAVIGAGSRGRAFAQRCLEAGYSVALEDVLSSNLRKAEQVLSDALGKRPERLRLAQGVEDAVRAADLAIDFVPDELESKLEIFSMMDRMAPPRTIFCTPTILSISDLAACTYRGPLCIGLVPFGDHLGATAALTRGSATDEATVTRVVAWLQSLGASVRVTMEQGSAG